MIPEKLPTVPTSKEIIERSFKATKNVQNFFSPKLIDKIKNVSVEKIKAMESVSIRALSRITTGFPKIEDLDEFERNLFSLLTDIYAYNRAIGRVRWGEKKIAEIATLSIRGIKKGRTNEEISRARSSFYGRFSSILEGLEDSLLVIRNARSALKKIPFINKDEKVIIIAGFPNVGKSSLVSRLTNLRPEIAVYPFTTKEINVGIYETENNRYQVLDVPGLLNRKNHNSIEKIALVALKTLGDLIICLTDPSEECGYSIDEQRKFCRSLEKSGKKVIEVENKLDIFNSGSDKLKISCVSGEGLEEFKRIMEDALNEGKDKSSGLFQRDSA
ncbi:MAG: GTPase [Thermoplasmatales archaeon]